MRRKLRAWMPDFIVNVIWRSASVGPSGTAESSWVPKLVGGYAPQGVDVAFDAYWGARSFCGIIDPSQLWAEIWRSRCT